jgi:hypothetical protein
MTGAPDPPAPIAAGCDRHRWPDHLYGTASEGAPSQRNYCRIADQIGREANVHRL